MIIEMDMIQTVAFAVILLLLGEFLVKRIKFLSTYCIPAPVVGGLIFAIIAVILKMNNILEFDMDTTLQNVAMTMFFTSVGFSASFKLLKQGGKQVVTFLIACIGLVILQNTVAVVIAKVLGLDPLLGMTTGSIPMTGGHGTAASVAKDVLEGVYGLEGATTISVAAATFGLVAGGMLGGPVGKSLIEGNNLTSSSSEDLDLKSTDLDEDASTPLVESKFYNATFLIFIAMGIGTLISKVLEKTGLTFPPYIGAMLAGAILRNIGDNSESLEIDIIEIDIIGGVSLSIFLSMALMSLKLWELADLAGEMLIMLLGQVVLMYLYAKFITFNLMGRDFDAAILAAGHCGFGLGATPNGIANMTSVTDKYGPSPTAFFTLPLVGSLFIDFVNIGIITIFLNIIA